MHNAISLSRPLPPPLPLLSRHPLDIDPLDFRRPVRPRPRVVSEIGDPPPHLERCHRPAAIDAVLETMRACLRNPVREASSRTRELRGRLTFEQDANGEMKAFRDERTTGRVLHRVEVDPATFDLDRPLPEAEWIASIRSELFHAVFKADWSHPGPIGDYVAWVLPRVCEVLKAEDGWKEPDDGIAEALGFEPLYVAMARDIPADPGLPTASLAAYNRVLRHADAFHQLLDDNEELIPLYGLFCDLYDFPADGEPLARLRRFLASHGCSPSLWRRLAGRWRMGRYREAIDALPMLCVGVSFLMVYRIVDALGPEHDPPEWLVTELARARIRPVAGNLFAEPLAAARRMAVLHSRADEDTREAMREMAEMVVRWSDEDPRVRPGDFARMTWPGLARRARLHAEPRHGDETLFEVPFGALETHGYRVAALASSAALWNEGYEMRHCIGRHVAQCATGRWFACSIRRVDGGKDRWTASFIIARRWKLDQISGFANARATPAAKAIAGAVVQWLNEHAVSDGGMGDRRDP
ncbi:MAG: PcfJ domain-containing protein [Betaproteobacteria bacterium]